MPARRLPSIKLRALALVAGFLVFGVGCQMPMWHSSFAPADAPPPAKPEPESKYWSSHSQPTAQTSATTASAAGQMERPASYESDPTQVVPLPAEDQTESAGSNNSLNSNLGAKLPGSIAENFANNLDPDESMTRSQHFREDLKCLWPEIKGDYANYYSWRNAAMLAVGFGIAAPLANTDVDQKIRDWYQTDVRSSTSDNIAKVAKGFGTGAYVIPGIVAGWLAGEMFYDTTPGNWLDQWGNRTIRAGLVGAPPMLFAQYLTGASRPDFPNAHSDWRLFGGDINGVSGHSFVCGLVFIDAAKMTDEIPMKMGFYALSTMAG
ncbi:MAG TPA: GlsB/YeaQ/YmgE family stress response membrane protein, partial [Pirellulales bacterium]